MMGMITVDCFKDGDEEQLRNLYSKTYSQFNGYVDRDKHEWKRLFLNHPYIGPGRILVARNNTAILGYLAFSNQLNPLFFNENITSEIYDLCISTEKSGLKAGELLIEAFFQQDDTKTNKSFCIRIPYVNKRVRSLLNRCGFGCIDNKQSIVVPIMDFKMLIETRISHLKGPLVIRNCRVNLHTDFSSNFFSEEDNASAIINIGNFKAGGVEIFCGKLVLSDILVQSLSPYTAFLMRKITIKPFFSSFQVISELNKISIKNDWVLPAIDWR